MKRNAPLFLMMALTFWGACPAGQNPTDEVPSLLPRSDINYHLIATAIHQQTLRVRGFESAVPAATSIEVRFGEAVRGPYQANDAGAFDFEVADLSVATDDQINLHFDTGDATLLQSFRVRNLSEALAQAVGPAVTTGQMPNDIVAGTERLWVLSSADSLLQSYSYGKAATSLAFDNDVYFPINTSNQGANPYQLAAHPDGAFVAVSLFTQQGIALVDASRHLEIDRFALASLPPFPLSTPVNVETPIDANNDGTLESAIHEMIPRHPQSMLWNGDTLWATTTNYLQFANGPSIPAVLGPGSLLRFTLEEERLVFQSAQTLPCKNPQDLKLDGTTGTLYVVCSGVTNQSAEGRWVVEEPGSLLAVPHDAPEQAETLYEFQDFSPATVTVTERTFVLGDSIGSRIALLDRMQDVIACDFVTIYETDVVDSVFAITRYGGNLLMIVPFATDRIWFYDLEQKALNPWPFLEPVPLASNLNNSLFKGVLKIEPRPGQPGVDFNGYSSFALTSLSSEIIPLDFSKVLGP